MPCPAVSQLLLFLLLHDLYIGRRCTHQYLKLAIMERPMPHPPEALVKDKQRPFNGAEFLESLRDGREVYIYGEQVEDVTTHPAFRNAAASVAQLYDALHAQIFQGCPFTRGCH